MVTSVESRFHRAGLTPTYFLTRRHEDLNIFLKAAIMGAESKKLHLPSKVAPLWRLLRKKGVAWGTRPDWSSPDRNIEVFVESTLQMGVAKAFSAFDKFLDECSAEISRYESHFGSECGFNSDDRGVLVDESNKLSRIYKRFALNTEDVDYFFLFFNFYQEIRNCIVHRAGEASSGAEKAYSEIMKEDAISKWAGKTNHVGPIQIARPLAGEFLEVRIPDVLLSSTTLLIIAKDMSKGICSRIGVEGVTYLAAQSVLRDMRNRKSPKWRQNKTFENAVAAFLGEYNRLGEVRPSDVQEILKRIDSYRSDNREFIKLRQ